MSVRNHNVVTPDFHVKRILLDTGESRNYIRSMKKTHPAYKKSLDVSVELHKRLRVRAAQDELTLRDLVEALLDHALRMDSLRDITSLRAR